MHGDVSDTSATGTCSARTHGGRLATDGWAVALECPGELARGEADFLALATFETAHRNLSHFFPDFLPKEPNDG